MQCAETLISYFFHMKKTTVSYNLYFSVKKLQHSIFCKGVEWSGFDFYFDFDLETAA